jgi:exodeoxyribonuclease V gamma subunit
MTSAPRIAEPAASSTALAPGFMVLHGNRLEDLRDLLTHFLKSQPLPVLQAETILVQSNGMKHWLEMVLADESALGICAATRMELPSSYLWQVYRQVLGAAAVPPHMPFDKSSLLWRLMRLLPELAAAAPVYAPLQRYLSAGFDSGAEAGAAKSDGRRLYQLAQQIADVFDAYQSYRADWLGDWAAGQDLLRGHDGKPVPLQASQAWQAQLWRDIRADVGEALAEASRASVHARFMATLQAQVQAHQSTGQLPHGVPPRIVVFGISSLSMQTVEALALLGQVAQVLLLVQNPCQYFWGDIVEGHERLRQQARQRQGGKPVAAELDHAATHPLLASWGKQGRDYLHLLDGFDQVEAYRGRVSRVDAFVDPASLAPEPSQLAQLQSAILNLEPLPPTPLALRTGDDSITLLTAHSPQREVEVLHDRLLAWFEADASLQPRDIMVMVPDMETFAPHIHAVFGRFGRGQPRHIPYSVADTTERQSPLVQALEQLLNLPRSRLSLVDWLSLFEVAAVRSRFGLSAADITQLQTWLSLAGVRWGLDARHRQAWGIAQSVPGRDQNTWAFGLRRLLLGYAVGAGSASGAPSVWGDTLPQAAIKSLDANLISQLLAWVDAISQTLAELQADRTPQQWCTQLAQLVERFFLASDDAEERQLQRLLEPLERWSQLCAEAQLDAPLPLDVVREHWLSQISESGLQQRFFGGGVQFGTLMPMRSIPFAAICLLGMNDGDYPRQSAPRDFDLMAQSWRAGDRSRREDDRYLFLEAILSARSRLYISWQGHRATDNTEQPPSVLVAQLQDYLQAGWAPRRLGQTQPLQAYSEAYFLQGSPFQTYDQEWARLHGAALAPAVGGNADTGPLSLPTVLAVEDLRLLLRQPVEVFFRSRLQIRFEELQEAQQELEPFALNGLEKYQIGQTLLQAVEPGRALAELKLSGQLPMAAFGERQSATFARELDVVLERRTVWQAQYPHASAAVSIDLLVDGVRIGGTLNGLWSTQAPPGHAGAPQPRLLQCSQRLGAVLEGSQDAQVARGHIVAALWANHLVACASGLHLTSVQLGLDGQVLLPPLPAARALEILQTLVEVYRLAWQRPLPVACKTAWAYLQAEANTEKPKDPHEAAQTAFEGGFMSSSDLAASPYLSRAFQSYEDLEAELPHWAHALYGALLAQTRVCEVQP